MTRPLQAKIGTQVTKHRKFCDSFKKNKSSFVVWERDGITYSFTSMEAAIEKHLNKISKEIIRLVKKEQLK